MSVFNRSEADEFSRGTKTLVVYPEVRNQASSSPEQRLEEAEGLALAIGLQVCLKVHFKVRTPRASTLLGSGQLEQIMQHIAETGAELLVIDTALTAIQQRNLEDKTGIKTIDRTGLILEIFGERAATAEGRLQVELAHLDYQSGRLVRSWTHLERQRGGFGFLGGPGETQIEADRRMIRTRMAKLRRELEEVKRTRALHRDRRKRAPWPVIALVGYTNAGKSTLFNRLTGASIFAENMLFATLDPTMREISIAGYDKAILSDTVGFVSDLPTQLVAAFRATLEEVLSSDVILHVRDISHPATEAQKTDVLSILGDLGLASADTEGGEGGIPIIEIWNKMDLLAGDERQSALEQSELTQDIASISAVTGEGISGLLEKLSQSITANHRSYRLRFADSTGEMLAWLHAHAKVERVRESGEGTVVHAMLNQQQFGQFNKRFLGKFDIL